ncbi:fabG [Symbiodinium necroappetens]|jgi:NAD(P)-dependent dehydrogenase (short-subunit alcohol dehydrogenase family)|uniref:FabG protein n=1 Tax=Symbiodinium necroappetens TaxID=1628268 RepID=A0A812IKR7_9DINO|nr:SDR family oxidoreductase [Pseudomonadales bacterium]CAE7149090.1 fabG [Symbiodinium necroappetens]
MEQTLSDQVALVTGANRGIGRQISISLATAGATVVASARNPATLDSVAQEIDQLGGQCTCVQLDVTEESMTSSVVEEIVAQHGQLNLLVNNAGIGAGSQYPWDLPVDEWWAVQEVNVRGAYLCSQAAMRQMVKQKSGRIIDVGSLIGANPNPNAAPYAVSKAALFRWNSCLADAAKEFGVSVFIISPGLVATDMTDQPQFADIPDDQWVPIEKSGELVVALASGKADKLAGRFIHALDDLDELIANAEEITSKNLQALTLNMYNPLL